MHTHYIYIHATFKCHVEKGLTLEIVITREAMIVSLCLRKQDECAWAIGNLAGGSAACRDILRAKGAVDPLIALLKVIFKLP